jgi:hypothetical protein
MQHGIAEEASNAEGIVRAHLNLGAVLGQGGREREALAVAQRGLAASRELGLERTMGTPLAANLAAGLFVLALQELVQRDAGHIGGVRALDDDLVVPARAP